jgi:hypothetical protein
MKYEDAIFAKSKYSQLNELGCRYNLSFSSQLIIGDRMIALDGVKRNLLVWDINNNPDQAYIIDLNQVATITLKKSYRSIGPGELKNRDIGEFLERIEMHFAYSNNTIITLTFYDCKVDDIKDLHKIERNATIWQMILSKLAGSKTDKILAIGVD